MLFHKYIYCPLGIIKITANSMALIELNFIKRGLKPPSHKQTENSIIIDCQKQLKEYFEGKRKKFNLPIELQGTTFQQEVWKEVSKIPHGLTKSYGEIAKLIGNPNSCRAVGQANGNNKIPIIIPCHRVIASDGTLGGYSSGIKTKKWLLSHEGII